MVLIERASVKMIGEWIIPKQQETGNCGEMHRREKYIYFIYEIRANVYVDLFRRFI